MLSLSREIGQEVRGPDERGLGRLADLTVRLGTEHGPHLVDDLLVRRRGEPDLLVPWSEVDSFGHTEVRLRKEAMVSRFTITNLADAIEVDELLLVRDVLDTQVVDVVGQRLARVADVVLTRTADGRLALVGVEVGFGGVLRRLGLGRLAARAGEDVVAWTDLHLTSDRGHAVQLATPRAAVHHLDPVALAALVARLDTAPAVEVLSAAGPEVAADVVLGAHPAVGERVLRAMPPDDASQIVAAMPAEHAHRWRHRLATTPRLKGRHLVRWRVWPRRRAQTAAPRPTR